MCIPVKPAQKANAYSPISVTVSRILRVPVKSVHPMNAPELMSVMLALIRKAMNIGNMYALSIRYIDI